MRLDPAFFGLVKSKTVVDIATVFLCFFAKKCVFSVLKQMLDL